MADNKVPNNAPGIAGFASESWSGIEEHRYGEGVLTTTHSTVKCTAARTFALYSVVHIAADGEMTLAKPTTTRPSAILATTVAFSAGQSMTLPFYREGHFEQDGLVWDVDFDTDAEKKAAFEGSISPTIFVSKKLFKDGAIVV